MSSLCPAAPPVGDPSEERPVDPWSPATCGTAKTASSPRSWPRPAAPPPTQRAAWWTEWPASPATPPPLPPPSPTPPPPPCSPPPPGLCLRRPPQPRPRRCAAACPCGLSCSCWPWWPPSCSWSTKPWRPTPTARSRPPTQKCPAAAQRRARRSRPRGTTSSLPFCRVLFLSFVVFFFLRSVNLHCSHFVHGCYEITSDINARIFFFYYFYFVSFLFPFLTKSCFTESLKRCDQAISVTLQGSWHLWKDSCASAGVWVHPRPHHIFLMFFYNEFEWSIVL